MQITPSAQRLTFRDLLTNFDFQQMAGSNPKGFQVLLDVIASELKINHDNYLSAADAAVLGELDRAKAAQLRGKSEILKEIFQTINRDTQDGTINGTTSSTSTNTELSTSSSFSSSDSRDTRSSYFSKS